MKFFALSRWNLVEIHFIHQLFGAYDTAAEAKKRATDAAAKYEDQTYVAVIKARSYDHALDIAVKKGFKF